MRQADSDRELEVHELPPPSGYRLS
jgi:hypothetical protein